MAEECRQLIEQSDASACELPEPLTTEHLSWMLKQISLHAEDWPVTKLHRWIGFVQCGMVAHGMLGFGTAKAMFKKVQEACGVSDEDQDLIDHLDPEHSFRLELGGES